MRHRFFFGLYVFFLHFFVDFLLAGDVANFVNLGFSRDGSYFTFCQYGYAVVSKQTYGSVVTVDIARNEFVKGSAVDERRQYSLAPEFGSLPDGILYLLIDRYVGNRVQFDIDYTLRGRLLYINSSPVPDVPKQNEGLLGIDLGEEHCREFKVSGSNCFIEFDDFRSSVRYRVTLKENIQKSGSGGIRSTLSLDLFVKDSMGAIKNYSVGHPGFVREGVVGYEIDSIILTPDENGLVFVIAKKFYSGLELCVRYMVETVVF